jgi:hypothetical protein
MSNRLSVVVIGTYVSTVILLTAVEAVRYFWSQS